MAQQETYNGWKNRSTWNVMLWLDNDEGTYHFYVSQVRAIVRNGGELDADVAKRIATDALGERTGDGIKLNSEFIDWDAIAAAMKESA